MWSLYRYYITPTFFYHFFSPSTDRAHYHSLNSMGKLKDLIEVEKLRKPEYSITARDLIQSSVGANLAHGVNYTAEEMTSGLQISATLPSDQQWSAQGAAGEVRSRFRFVMLEITLSGWVVGYPAVVVSSLSFLPSFLG